MLEQSKIDRNTTYIISIFIVHYIILVLHALAPPLAFDSYWHLQMGKDLLENGLSPWIDHYSFTQHGNEITSVPVIFQLLLASFVYIFDESNGFFYFKVFYITLFMTFLYLYFRQIKASWRIVLLLLPFVAYFISLRLIIRPEIISYVLMVICLSLYLRARESFSTKELLSICLLMLVWTNYHSPVFGYIIIFGLFLDKAIHKLFHGSHDFSWPQWFSWGSIIFLIGFINPSGQHAIIGTLSMLNSEFGKYTMEYLPSNTIYSTNIIVHLSWILSVYTMILSLIKKQYGYAFIALFLVYFSLSTARLVTSVAIINFCILGLLLSRLSYSNILSSVRPVIKKALLIQFASLPLMAFLALSASTLLIIYNLDNESKTINQRYPVKIVDYLKNYQGGGNILNHMGAGGYLINKLSPDFKVFIDGRTNILHPIDYLKMASLLEHPVYDENNIIDSTTLNKVLDTYDIQYAIFRNTPEILLMFNNTDKLNLNFADDSYLLFSEEKEIAFPISSQLMIFPMCWNEKYSSEIQKEIILADSLFSDKSYTLKSELLFLKTYISKNNKSIFLDSLDPMSLPHDSGRRLAAYMALNNHEYSIALKYFATIRNKNDYDILMAAYSLIRNDDLSMAEYMLSSFFSKNEYPNKTKLPYEKIAIFHHLLKTVQDNHELRIFKSSYVQELEDKLTQENFNNGDPLESVIPYQYACKSFL